MNPVSKPLFEPQDENNPRYRHFNFPMNKDVKQIDLKNPRPELQESGLSRNKPYGIPRTEHSMVNQHKLQLDYHHMMQEIENMKQQFFTDHFQVIR